MNGSVRVSRRGRRSRPGRGATDDKPQSAIVEKEVKLGVGNQG